MINLPLTPKYLEQLLIELDKQIPYTLNEEIFDDILARSQGSVLNDVLSVSNFNDIFYAIRDGRTLKLILDNHTYIACAQFYDEVASDDYKSLGFEIVGTMRAISGTNNTIRLKVGFEMLAGSIRMYEKIVTEV